MTETGERSGGGGGFFSDVGVEGVDVIGLYIILLCLYGMCSNMERKEEEYDTTRRVDGSGGSRGEASAGEQAEGKSVVQYSMHSQ